MNPGSWVLGTATFGSNYGIANREIGFIQDKPARILIRACERGINSVDTSPSYKNAGKAIGEFHGDSKKFNCFTKFPIELELNRNNAMNFVNSSLKLLQVQSLAGIYFHRSAQLLALSLNQGRTILEELLESGKVQKVGVSVYQIDEVREVVDRYPELKLIQVPENILDQRLLNVPELASLKKLGVEIHVRSILLQGLLSMKVDSLPSQLRQAGPHLAELDKIAQKLGISRLNLCLSYLAKIKWADKFLIGVANCMQLDEIVDHVPTELKTSDLPGRLSTELVDPRNWTR